MRFVLNISPLQIFLATHSLSTKILTVIPPDYRAGLYSEEEITIVQKCTSTACEIHMRISEAKLNSLRSEKKSLIVSLALVKRKTGIPANSEHFVPDRIVFRLSRFGSP